WRPTFADLPSSVGIPYTSPNSRDWRMNTGNLSGVNQAASASRSNQTWTWRSTWSGIQSISSGVQGPTATPTASKLSTRSASEVTGLLRTTAGVRESIAATAASG